jgi:trehalose/maltose transport system substrate-binding protein
MMRNWPIHYARILAGGPGTIRPKQFSVARLPYPSVLGGQDLAVSRSTKHLDAALQVVRFLTDKASERCLFAVGGFPATRSDAYDEDANGRFEWPATHPLPPLETGTSDLRCGTKKGNWTGIGSTIREAVDAAQPRPAIPYYTEFSDRLAAAAHSMFPGQHGDASNATITKLIDDLRAVSGNRVAKP